MSWHVVVLGSLVALLGLPHSVSIGGLEPVATPRVQSPCSDPRARDFDFWVGEWRVMNPDGSLVGTNSITSILNGCVLHERYSTPAGYAGESFNIFDGSRGVWHQTWVDMTGALLVLEGGFRDGAMVMQGETQAGDGSKVLNRITWSLVEGDPDRVRQYWETSGDDGESWSPAFDGLYLRQR